eukprot:TRINITY_DN3697_c0_g1_i1.p1 TRINITY_DN3697_c0_g1~~TRINITY_DN3697_c0_g1_i1.p1  ORF type:complete len:123 (+),score=2.62 TRINITY_DN3697_c0_g1_i1:384-752(+)
MATTSSTQLGKEAMGGDLTLPPEPRTTPSDGLDPSKAGRPGGDATVTPVPSPGGDTRGASSTASAGIHTGLEVKVATATVPGSGKVEAPKPAATDDEEDDGEFYEPAASAAPRPQEGARTLR